MIVGRVTGDQKYRQSWIDCAQYTRTAARSAELRHDDVQYCRDEILVLGEPLYGLPLHPRS